MDSSPVRLAPVHRENENILAKSITLGDWRMGLVVLMELGETEMAE
jgi:hypothetical protein